LDGIDLDLYYPQGRQVYHDLFMVFLEEASAAWHQAGLLVSIGLHAKARMPLHAYDWVDRVNVMAYDMVEEPGDFHASLRSTQKAIQFVLDSGCPASKILLGIPFYARHLENPQLALTFSELYDAVVGEDGNGQDLSRAHEGYQWSSQQSMKQKVDYLHGAGLGGIYVWEVGQDKQTVKYPGGLLLQAVSEYMDHVNKKKEIEKTEL
jgi:chitinase